MKTGGKRTRPFCERIGCQLWGRQGPCVCPRFNGRLGNGRLLRVDARSYHARLFRINGGGHTESGARSMGTQYVLSSCPLSAVRPLSQAASAKPRPFRSEATLHSLARPGPGQQAAWPLGVSLSWRASLIAVLLFNKLYVVLPGQSGPGVYRDKTVRLRMFLFVLCFRLA